jgi:hypothetical protein
MYIGSSVPPGEFSKTRVRTSSHSPGASGGMRGPVLVIAAS